MSKVRMTLELPQGLNDRLVELAEKTGGTKSDVLRKGIALVEVALRAREEGRRFGIVDADQPLAVEVVGI